MLSAWAKKKAVNSCNPTLKESYLGADAQIEGIDSIFVKFNATSPLSNSYEKISKRKYSTVNTLNRLLSSLSGITLLYPSQAYNNIQRIPHGK